MCYYFKISVIELDDTLHPIDLASFIFVDVSAGIILDLVTVLTESSAALIVVVLPEISTIL
jgi:MinD-like ATPase involved in chromosome partitioning or flagellar assembly